MSSPTPAFFISHGSPDILVRNTSANRFMKSFGTMINKNTKAIVVVSAHWDTQYPTITYNERPNIIYDFYGFPKELYRFNYNPPGDLDVSKEIMLCLKDFYPETSFDYTRGIDHGAWIPLLLALPLANIPVIQLSIQSYRDARYHYELGEKLSSLTELGITLLASGSMTHNLGAINNSINDKVRPEISLFAEWMHSKLVNREDNLLIRWQEKAPYAKWNHPTHEHILPLFVILGATKSYRKIKRIHSSIDYNALSMDSYKIG